jgi:endonuclease/exonuclease/phosphatase family metal-dependent hydrolase
MASVVEAEVESLEAGFAKLAVLDEAIGLATPTRRSRCSICRVEGHNRKTCKLYGVLTSPSSPLAAEAVAGGDNELEVSADLDSGDAREVRKATPHDKRLRDFGLCGCAGVCDSMRCSCKKDGRSCDPRYCGCCTGIEPICQNAGMNPAFYRRCPDNLPIVRPFGLCLEKCGARQGALVVASWNIQSFGHNMYWDPQSNGEGTGKRLSRPFLATVKRVVSFIEHHNVDLLFVQETMDTGALEFLASQLNNYKLEWLPTFVDVGLGFNRSNPNVRPTEFAAVVYKDTASHTQLNSQKPLWQLSLPLSLCEFPVENYHCAITELRDRFKRYPAYILIVVNGETICLVTVHLPSDSGIQSLRLGLEISSLSALATSLKQTTGAHHVILLGDFNRNPNTVAFTNLMDTHWPCLHPQNGTVRTNTGKIPHVYDNFFVPHGLWDRITSSVGHSDWMSLGLESDVNRLVSDHYPVLMSIHY